MRNSIAILLAAAAFAIAPSLATAQDASHGLPSDDFFNRWGEIAGAALELQVAGVDLCETSTAHLPGLYVIPEASPSHPTIPAGTVASVHAGGPAELAGVRAGDQVVAINGEQAVRRRMMRTTSRIAELFEDAKQTSAPLQLELLRDGQPVSVTIQPVEACNVEVLYVQRALPIPQQPGVVVVTTAIDELTNDRNEMLLFLAPEIAGSMNGQSTRRRAAERTAGFLGNAVGFATGQDLGGVAQLGVGARFNKRQMLEADRVGLYLIARLGIDVQSAVDFWSAAYSASATNAVRSFFGGRPTLEERLENLTEVAEEINTKLEQGQPLALR